MSKNLDIVDEVMSKLVYLISIFDIISTVDSPRLRGNTLSEFAEFMMANLDDVYQKIGSLDTKQTFQ